MFQWAGWGCCCCLYSRTILLCSFWGTQWEPLKALSFQWKKKISDNLNCWYLVDERHAYTFWCVLCSNHLKKVGGIQASWHRKNKGVIMESAISGKFLRLHSSCTWKCHPWTELWLGDLTAQHWALGFLAEEDSWLWFGTCWGRILPLSERETRQGDARNSWCSGLSVTAPFSIGIGPITRSKRKGYQPELPQALV